MRVEIEGKAVSEQKLLRNPYRDTAPPYALLGGTVEYSFGKFKLFGGVENIADFRQTDPGPQRGPREGRQIYLGAKVNF